LGGASAAPTLICLIAGVINTEAEENQFLPSKQAIFVVYLLDKGEVLSGNRHG
jgi:hypothetical protein